MNNFSKELTIIVPTKNRFIWIERILQYYDKYNFLGHLIIADSSDNLIHNQIKHKLKNFKKLNVSLIHLPKCNCEAAVKEASKKINTKYSVFVADDDLILIEGINKAINFLDLNPTYIGAIGESYMISTLNNSAYGKINSLLNYNLKSYDDEDKYFRIESYFSDPRALCFSITKSEIFKESYNNLMKLEKMYQTFVIGENLQAAIYLGKGKFYKLKFDYLVRQSHNDNTYHKIDFKSWSSKKNFIIAKNLLLDYLKKLFRFEKNIEIEKMINDYFDNFNKIYSRKQSSKIKILSLLRNTYIKTFIKNIKYYLFDLYKIKKFKKKKDLENYLNLIEKKN